MPRRLMITVDVEAQPRRAERDSLERLIWGRYPGSQDAGIGRMMDIADANDIELTMFTDYCEEGLYGDGILDVAREIDRRGHDLQLHAHLDFMPAAFWNDNALKREFSLNLVSEEQSKAMFDFLCDAQIRATGKKARAFRGGGYRFNRHILNAMVERDVVLDSSVNVSRTTQPAKLPYSKQFVWSNGCLEVPVSCVPNFLNLNRAVDFNFNASALSSPKRMISYLKQFFDTLGEDATAVLVMHSWSLLVLNNASGWFEKTSEENCERFDEFLRLAKQEFEFTTAASEAMAFSKGQRKSNGALSLDLLDSASRPADGLIDSANDGKNIRAGALSPGKSLLWRLVEKARATHRPSAFDATAPAMIATSGTSSPVCPICAAPKSRFVDMGGRQCPDCSSLERQRVFACVLASETLPWKERGAGRVMAVSPSASEHRIFEKVPHDAMTCVDVRPLAGIDLAADVCAMPEIASASFETVFASYVMACVHDLNAALSEIKRVLKPGGVFVSIEQVRYGEPTVEHSDPAIVTGWYGEEVFDEFNVGSFRTLGKEDYQAILARHFKVQCMEGADPITGVKLPVYLCSKPLESGLVNRLIGKLWNGRPATIMEDAMSNEFEDSDRSYREARKNDSSLTYAQYSVRSQIDYIKRGGAHPSLGPNLIDNKNWAKDGLGTFEEYIRVIPGINPSFKLVDYGCGSLRLGNHIINYLDQGNYLGVDVWYELVEMGINMLDVDLVSAKNPQFRELNRASVDEAVAMDADVVIACSVAYQVHPLDYPEFISNLMKITAKPGSFIVFDAKIGPKFNRYKSSGWSYTQQYYDQLFAGYEKVLQKYQMTQSLGGQDVDTFLMIYRRK
jgi:Methyltransferase domain